MKSWCYKKEVPDLIFCRVANVLLDQVLPPHVNDCLAICVAIMPDQEKIDYVPYNYFKESRRKSHWFVQ